jgi:hypothetical protein
VVLGLAGLFGYRTGTVSAAGDGFRIELSYPRFARPGQSVQWILHVHREGGLPRRLGVVTTTGYFDTFDLNDIEPQPDASTGTDGSTSWTFVTDGGTDLTVTMDALVATSLWRGSTATTSLLIHGERAVTVTYTTRVYP